MSDVPAKTEVVKPADKQPKLKKPTLKERLAAHMEEYGKIALVVHFSVFALTVTGYFIAIQMGFWDSGESSGGFGTLFVAWAAAKLTFPIRIVIVLVSTPIIARIFHMVRGTPSAKSMGTDK